jgi:hypothetical protein
MIGKLNDFIVGCSKSWWKFLLLLAGQGSTIAILNSITAKFPAVTDEHIPFDMQNTLTSEMIFAQLESYTPEAFSLYGWFQAVDYVFPLFAGLMLAAAGTFALRHALPGVYAWVLDKGVLWLWLLPSIFDWLENLNFLWVITAWPTQAATAASLGVAAKMAKLGSMGVVFTLVGLLLLIAAGRWIGSKAAGK